MQATQVVLVVVMLLFRCSSALVNPQVEALDAVKISLKASHNYLLDWNINQIIPCPRSHITCNSNGDIVSLTITHVGCSGTLSPQIGELDTLDALILRENGLVGEIPVALGNLINLTRLDLRNNRLTGPIPSSIGSLKKLKFLSLNNNNLSGSIPVSLASIETLISIFAGNYLNCGTNFQNCCDSRASPQAVQRKRLNIGLIAGAAFLLTVLLAGVIIFKNRNNQTCPSLCKNVPGQFFSGISYGQLKQYTWKELETATDNFSSNNVIGQGGFGSVYKAVLADGTTVAVKRLLNPVTDSGFNSEIEAISVAIHKNLLRLLGFCTTPTESLLVYPFMKNLSVAHHLRERRSDEPVLNWETRKRVALGTAQGLEYLHEHCNPKIIHRDVKTANVLLDDNFEAVVGDFGLAKLVDVKRTLVTTLVRGTMGHIAPEYFTTGRASAKTDVFGFGAMLLELVTGQRVIDMSRMKQDDDLFLIDHVKRLVKENSVDTIVDPTLGNNYVADEAEAMVKVSLICVQESPEHRPLMSEVVRMLEGEGLVEAWERREHAEDERNDGYDSLQKKVCGGESSGSQQTAVELSGGR